MAYTIARERAMNYNVCTCGCSQKIKLGHRFAHGHNKGNAQGPNAFNHRADGTTVIYLNRHGVVHECTVWTKDYPLVAQYHWSPIQGTARTRYAYTYAPRRIFMHRLLIPNCAEVDHKNHDGLDNRVYDAATDTGNIRPSTPVENRRNKKKQRGRYSSSFIGVSRCNKLWRAYIVVAGAQIRLGMFDTEIAAAHAYDAAARHHHGAFASQNFSNDQGVHP